MTALDPDPAPPAVHHPPSRIDGRGEIPLTQIYLPFAMVIAFGAFLVIAGYTVGSVMSGIARDKTETDARLAAIEKEVTAIKNILTERAVSSQTCRSKP